ncbi:type VII secretion protein EccCa [Demequina globuliformis]|uniref:type VII secretion protein EccCa n=1 Tax=Demequina globuliformis TaxID=676202 RepID=UPI0007859EA0|nr:type VII secretion protein EccCa [Demequina globuliformis]
MTGPRLAPPRVPTGTLPIQAPPELEPSDGASGMLASMLPMLGSVGAIVMISMTRPGPAGYLTGGMFLLSALGFVAVNGWRQRAQRNAQLLTSRREYLAYLSDLRTTVRTAAKQQRRAANWIHPAPTALPFLAEERTRVWERSVSDGDFLHTRVGRNDQPLCLEMQPPELPALAQLDPVSASAAHRFMLTHEVQHRLPCSVPLRDYARVEVTGAEYPARSLARAMVASIATLHHPNDVRIVIAADPAVLDQWEWAKWLPHCHSPHATDGLGAARMIGSDLRALEAMLPSDVAARAHFTPGDGPLPHIILVTDGLRLQGESTLLARQGVQGVTVLDIPASWGELQGRATLRLALDQADDATAVEVISTQAPSFGAVADTLSIAEAEATARRLLPLYDGPADEGDEGARTSTEQRELVELLGLPDVRDIDFSHVWQPRPERDRLRVPIGQTTTGAPMVLDIKESAQQGMGPHGVMIGATGSGKSEVLRTMVLALAMTHSPEQLNFVLVDFKGGATFAGMADMPHVSAVITNLADEIALVDRFQDALTGEVTRRQELLRKAGNFVNVTEYEKARKSGRTDLEPLPALLIVADEFSELLAAKPEFIETFINIGRVGRSLQVHLLLASQRLEEGKLRGLDTFLSYRIGLRTFSAAESRSILGVPDAYTLPQQPGVGYLKADTETMTQFRAAYVSGPPPRRTVAAADGTGPARQRAKITAFTAAAVTAEEPVETDEDQPAPLLDSGPAEKRSTFDLAVSRMAGHGPAAHQVWLPPLDIPATLDQLMPDLAVDPEMGLVSRQWRAAGTLTVPLGIVDVPLEQRRESLTVSLGGAAGHMAIVGGPLSGKSTLARTTVAALALTHTPQEVQFYVLDFGGGTFVGMRDLPHIAGVATRSEPEVVRRAVSEVSGILNAREQYFRDQGIDSIETYRQRRAAGTANDGYGDVFLVIDGWGTVRADFEAIEAQIQAIAARGLTFGIHVIITASRWMEVRMNIKDLLGTRIELRLGDPSDSEVDRKAAVNVTTNAPGRGLAPTRLQMLTALPRVDGSSDAESLSDGIADLISKTTQAYRGPAGPNLRLLPERITLTQVRELVQPDDKRLLLGIDEAGLAPFGVNVMSEPHLFLYGDAGSGKTSFLRAYAQEITRLFAPHEAKIFTIDYRRSLLGDLPSEYVMASLSTHDEATAGVQELVDFFGTRVPGKDVTPEQLRSRSWWKGAEGFVLVDDYDLVATSQGNPLAPLATLLPQALDLGLHVVLTRRAGGASRAAYDPVIQRFTDLGVTGILLSGNPEEGALIGKVKPAPAVPGRAQIVSRDQGLIAAQLAYQASQYS